MVVSRIRNRRCGYRSGRRRRNRLELPRVEIRRGLGVLLRGPDRGNERTASRRRHETSRSLPAREILKVMRLARDAAPGRSDRVTLSRKVVLVFVVFSVLLTSDIRNGRRRRFPGQLGRGRARRGRLAPTGAGSGNVPLPCTTFTNDQVQVRTGPLHEAALDRVRKHDEPGRNCLPRD